MKENMKNEKEETILRELEKIKKETINSSDEKYYSVSVNQIKEVAGKFQLPNREIEISALQNNIIPERYQRNLGVSRPSSKDYSHFNFFYSHIVLLSPSLNFFVNFIFTNLIFP
ncbi:unnamed protein product [marine sediment metagenome]|uniref:Uncharacterized protein n=1 Tax=marine sediment metagenome TaxID=412755 RepID=X1QS98_9ZZZZ